MPLKSRYVRTYRRFININHKVENSQNILSTIESFLDVMESSYERSYHRKHKNKLHTYLSSSDKYVTMLLGTASSAGAFDWGSDELESFKSFLTEGFRIED